MPIVSSYHFAIGPIAAVVAVALLGLLSRWVFSPRRPAPRSGSRPAARLAGTGDYGLLVPVVTVRTAADAQMLRSVLADAGIRATVGPAPGSEALQLLVFRESAARARALVGARGR